jgi:hypothetical protein
MLKATFSFFALTSVLVAACSSGTTGADDTTAEQSPVHVDALAATCTEVCGYPGNPPNKNLPPAYQTTGVGTKACPNGQACTINPGQAACTNQNIGNAVNGKCGPAVNPVQPDIVN